MGESEQLSVRPVETRRERRTFVRLPWRVNGVSANWAGPLISDENRRLRPESNPALAYCDSELWLARRGRQPVGRVMGIVNSRHNRLVGDSSARFHCFDCVDDEEAAHALLGQVEAWAAARGCSKLVGPMGFSDQDPEGLLVDGFETEPTLATLHGPAFLAGFLERAGFVKEVDYVTYRVPTVIPERVARVASAILARGHFRIRSFSRRSELRDRARDILGLMNATFTNLYGYFALDEAEMDDLARRFVPLLDPRFVKTVERGSELVGFIIGMPNAAPGFREAHGRLFPFGFWHLLMSMRRSSQLDFLLTGVLNEFRGRGVDALLGMALMTEAIGAGMDRCDSHHVLETNRAMRAECEAWGGTVYKRHRIYVKQID